MTADEWGCVTIVLRKVTILVTLSDSLLATGLLAERAGPAIANPL